MLEFTLFLVLLGVFYWGYNRSKSKNEKRWSEVMRGVQHLYAELKNRDTRWSETKSQVESLGKEVEKLQAKSESLESRAPVPAAHPTPAHEAPAPAPHATPSEHELPVAPIAAPVPIPPAAVIPPLSSASSARLVQESRPTQESRPAEGQHARPPYPLPVPTPAHPATKTPPPVAKEPLAPKVLPPAAPAGEVLKLAHAPSPATPAAAEAAHPPAPFPPPRFTIQPPPGPPMSECLKSLLNWEEILTTNYLIKIGVAVVVIGIAGFIFSNLDKIPLWLRFFASFAIGLAMLISGVRFEPSKYRLLARAGMGGGWAVIFITTWSLHHAGRPPLLASEPVDFVLLMIVATVMVVHTLRYNSQLVTETSSGNTLPLPARRGRSYRNSRGSRWKDTFARIRRRPNGSTRFVI
jgi:hypothetical protein